MLLSEFSYDLPAELIAQEPLTDRAASRMMVVDRGNGTLEDRCFDELPAYLTQGDVLVLNNTKVFPARLNGTSDTGAAVEIFLVRDLGEGLWETLARPARRLPPGKHIVFGEELTGVVIDNLGDGRLVVRLESPMNVHQAIDDLGKTPLPPYIKRDGAAPDNDRERYQTVFAKNRGAIAAPTAGLHFTPAILDRIRTLGVQIAELTLHVGYGTFEPVRVDDLSHHVVAPERYTIDEETAAVLNRAIEGGRRIVAVGTTSTRALENSISRHGRFDPGDFDADLTITPGYKFRAAGALVTNFHLPQSSLLVLTSTFGGHELIMKAYGHAVDEKYRFYSYGDCMLIV